MNHDDLQALARQYFIFDTGMSRANLIRKIQLETNHLDCFSTGKLNCAESTCPWFDECVAGERKEQAPEHLGGAAGRTEGEA